MSLERIELWQDPEVVEHVAERHYRDLPFHNFEHALDVRDNVVMIAAERAKTGYPIDPEIIEDAATAALFHDAGFYIPPHIHGFRSKEVFAGWISVNELPRLGMPLERAKRVGRLILPTELGVTPITKGEKLLRRADLANVYNNSDKEIIRKTFDLFNEDAILKRDFDHPGEIKTDIRSFVDISRMVLSRYNEDNVALDEGELDENGNSLYNRSFSKKLGCFLPAVASILLEEVSKSVVSSFRR